MKNITLVPAGDTEPVEGLRIYRHVVGNRFEAVTVGPVQASEGRFERAAIFYDGGAQSGISSSPIYGVGDDGRTDYRNVTGYSRPLHRFYVEGTGEGQFEAEVYEFDAIVFSVHVAVPVNASKGQPDIAAIRLAFEKFLKDGPFNPEVSISDGYLSTERREHCFTSEGRLLAENRRPNFGTVNANGYTTVPAEVPVHEAIYDLATRNAKDVSYQAQAHKAAGDLPPRSNRKAKV